MDTRREFIRKSMLLSAATGLSSFMPESIQRAMAIDPAVGSTFLDAEHVVILMQENRSFDHSFGTLRGVRGFNDPRAVMQPNNRPVWFQANADGDVYAPFRLNIKDSKVTWMGSLPHSRASQVDAYNAGKHDKWLPSKKSSNKQYAHMPLTMGYYTRQDLPFNYAMADAFTVCDQNFCSAMTSTTPNRSFFWTGKITDMEDGRPKANIRNDNFTYANMPWKTFPELLEENGIPWKFYQNELSCGGGFKGEERSWLANFGCNNLEFFRAYNVKFSPKYYQSLQKRADELPVQMNGMQEEIPSGGEAADKTKNSLRKKKEVLDDTRSELEKWNPENFAKLSEKEQNLFRNAFTTNNTDPNFRHLTELTYTDGKELRTLKVPKGDLLHQFREDVDNGRLPTVSWLAAPQNFSDHPSAPWYGAWYVSEVLDILTNNPDVWKKTIFIVTYDENDGYFDHVPPFSIPDNNKPGTGKCSAGIETEIEHVRFDNEVAQGVPPRAAREAPIGLGFRVPMMIASPWSRGGKVCSEVFDHTSTLQFLETFINKKYNKSIHLDNISQWRRTICGDLTNAFTPFDGSKLEPIPFLDRDAHVEDIYNAKFKKEPAGYKRQSEKDIERFMESPAKADVEFRQEKGVRPSSALPYELYTHGALNKKADVFILSLEAGKTIFGDRSLGVPYTVSAPGKYTDNGAADTGRNWAFAVAAGDALTYEWPLSAFDNGQYHLRVAGPNGFYRSFKGSSADAAIGVNLAYEEGSTGNAVLKIVNHDASKAYDISITDLGKTYNHFNRQLPAGGNLAIVLDLTASHHWYDVKVTVRGLPGFEQRYAGRVETGKEGISDPMMGEPA